MDELFKGLDGRLRVSGKLADSIMMGIVNSAMESAHQKSCSNGEGILVRLNEKSRFCELAILQLDWCLKFLQEETEDDNTIVDSTCDRQKLLSDLLETRDRIHNRLRETELMIVEKDRELTDRMEIECKLRLALDVKEEDITSLNAALGLEREKHRRSKKSEDGIGEVDEQLCKIKAKLEEGQTNLKSLLRRISSKSLDFDKMVIDFDDVIEDKSNDVNSKMMLEGMHNLNLEAEFKDMATDMDVLKGKIDSSFKTMANYVSLFKTILDEQRWVMDAERDIVSIVNSGFLRDMQCNYDYLDDKVPVENKKLTTFMDDIAMLRDELEKLGPEISRDVSKESKRINDGDVSKENRRNNDGDDEGAMMDCNEDFTEQESPSCLSVAQKIKTHEFIIKKKSIELESVKVEKSREKGNSALRSLRSLDAVHDVIARVNMSMDSIMNDKTLGKSVYGKTQSSVQSVKRVTEQSNGKSCCCNLMLLEHSKDVDRLCEEKEELECKSMILEATYSIVLTDLVREINEYSKDVDRLIVEKAELQCKCKISEQINSIILTDLVRKMNEHSEDIADRLSEEREDLECNCMISADIYTIVLADLAKKLNKHSNNVDQLSEEKKDLECKSMIFEKTYSIVLTDLMWKINEYSKDVDKLIEEKTELESKRMISEQINSIVLTDLVTKMNEHLKVADGLSKEKEDLEWKCLILEDMHSIVFADTVMKLTEHSNDAHRLSEEKEDLECKYMILENIYPIVLTDLATKANERSKDAARLSEENEDLECKHMILDDIYSIVLTELVRELNDQCLEREIRDQIRKEMHKSILLETVNGWNDEINICSIEQEFKEETYHHVLRELIKDFNSRTNVISVLDHCLFDQKNNEGGQNDVSLPLEHQDSQHDQNISSVVDLTVVNEKQAKGLVTEHDRDMQAIQYKLIMMPLSELANKIVNFEDIACKWMRQHSARLEDLNHCLPLFIDEVIDIKKQKARYEKAFMRRCYDLQTAEREVDLLGDEVDLLYDLVEKIYHVLHHHYPILKHHSEVRDVLRLIRKQLLEREACLST